MNETARILIISGDAKLRENLAGFLVHAGLRAVACSTLAAALESGEVFHCAVIEHELDDGTAASALGALSRAGMAFRAVTLLRTNVVIPVIEGRVFNSTGGLEAIVAAIVQVLRTEGVAPSTPPPPESGTLERTEARRLPRPSQYSMRPGKVETVPPRRRLSS